MTITSTRGTLVWRLLLGLLVLAGSLFLSQLTSTPAQAVDCTTAAAICANNGGTSTSGGGSPGATSSGGSCGRGLPSAPTVDCGYATIQRNYSAGVGSSTVSGLPANPWMFWDNQYANQCIAASYQAYNPYSGGYDTYYAKGIYWTDLHYWIPDVRSTVIPRTVTVAPAPTTTTPGYYRTTVIRGKTTITWVPPVTTTTGSVTPVTVTFYTYTDYSDPSKNFTRQRTYSSPGTYSYDESAVVLNVIWNGRSVSYSCAFPAAPQLKTVADCPTSVGPGYMTGPTGNAVSTPWPVPTGPGTFDPQTEKKKWQTAPSNAATNPNWVDKPSGGTLYSAMGMAWRDATTRQIFSQKGNPQALALVKGCADLTFQTSAKDQPCQYLGSTIPGKSGVWLPASDPLCDFTPGNYAKNATGMSTQCKWVQYSWDWSTQSPSSQQLFLSCTTPAQCANCAVSDWAHWLCNDVNGANGFNNTASFFCKTNDTYKCVFSSTAPVITSPDGVTSKNGSQILANGKKWKIFWAAPSTAIAKYVNGSYVGTVPAQNAWLQWVQASNSQPSKTGAATSSASQPVYANWQETATPATAASVLTDSGSASGKTTWSDTTLYLRAYKGAGVNTSGSTMYVGKTEGVPNFATVKPSSLVPFGVYAAYVYTHRRTTSTGQGGTVIVNVPETCATQMAKFSITSGRPTS